MYTWIFEYIVQQRQSQVPAEPDLAGVGLAALLLALETMCWLHCGETLTMNLYSAVDFDTTTGCDTFARDSLRLTDLGHMFLVRILGQRKQTQHIIAQFDAVRCMCCIVRGLHLISDIFFAFTCM